MIVNIIFTTIIYGIIGCFALMAYDDINGYNHVSTTHKFLVVVFWPLAAIYGIYKTSINIYKSLMKIFSKMKIEIMEDDVLKIKKFFKEDKKEEKDKPKKG